MRGSLVVAGLICALALSACETTQQTSARLAKQQKQVVSDEKALSIDKTNPEIDLVDERVITDDSGSVVVATLVNESKKALINVPVAIDVRDSAGKTVFRNDEAGADPALVGVSLLEPGKTTYWVHDQVLTDDAPASVAIKTGTGSPAPSAVPEIATTKPDVELDPNAGNAALGTLTNESAIDQRELTVFAVARKGGKIVAAGRGTIELVRAGDEAPFEIFLTGDPKGAKVTIEALPSTFK